MGQVSPKNSAESRPAGEIREGKMPIKGEEAATNGRLKNIRKKA